MSVREPLELFGIQLVGINAENGHKLLLSIGLVAAILIARRLLRAGVAVVLRSERLVRVRFWVRQAISIVAAAVLVIGLVSLWFDDPTRVTTALGLITAGLAFALQKVITALAGYVVIMRGQTFSVGDRIVMGGVRGDVIALRFTQTTIMEMGQPPPVQRDEPAMWVQSRQYTGRLVTVSNARVFDEPIYNYTRELPYIWEEIAVAIGYDADRDAVERALLEIAQRHTDDIQQISEHDRAELARRYVVASLDTAPRVYVKMTDDWLELTVRFLANTHAVRELKDAITREILDALDTLHVPVASRTIDIVGLPPLRLEADNRFAKLAK